MRPVSPSVTSEEARTGSTGRFLAEMANLLDQSEAGDHGQRLGKPRVSLAGLRG